MATSDTYTQIHPDTTNITNIICCELLFVDIINLALSCFFYNVIKIN